MDGVSDDDDEDCVHDWVLTDVLADQRGADTVSRCSLCGAVSYETRPPGNRQPLGGNG